jgi:hypothetical protein
MDKVNKITIPGLEIDEYFKSAALVIPSSEQAVFKEFVTDLSRLPLTLRRICRGCPVAPFIRPFGPRTYTMHFSCRDYNLWQERMQIWEYWPYLRREMLLFFYENNSEITFPWSFSQAASALKELAKRLEIILTQKKSTQDESTRLLFDYCLIAFNSTARLLNYICIQDNPACRNEAAALLKAELNSTQACLELLGKQRITKIYDENLIFSRYVLEEKIKNLKSASMINRTNENKLHSDFLKWALPVLPDEKSFEFKEKIDSETYLETVSEKISPNPDEFVIDNAWTLALDKSSSTVLNNACLSFRESMKKSFGIELNQTFPAKPFLQNQIIIRVLAKDLKGPKDYSISCKNGNILVCGGGEAGCMFALYYLEYLLLMRGGLCLKKNLNITRHSLFDVRIAMTCMGWMHWPDNYLEMLPRYGIDGIYISPYANICGGQRYRTIGHIQSPQKVHQLIERAKKWGLKIYCQFINQGSPDTKIDEEDTLNKMLEEFPQIDGLILLTEGYTASPEKINKLAEIAKQIKPELDIIVWNYNGKVSTENNELKIDFAKKCSLDTIQMLTWVKGAKAKFDGEWRYIYDYTISVIGPSKVWAEKQLKNEKNKGAKKVYARADAWNNWQFGTLPYLPFPQQWLKRHDSLVENGINGSLDSWTYGFTPNFIAEIKNLYCWDNAPSRELILRKIASREFGKTGIEQVIEAWELFSEGIQMVPDTGHGILCNACASPLFFEKPPQRMWQTESEINRSRKTMYMVTANACWPYAPQWAFLYPDFSNRQNMAETYVKSYLAYFEKKAGEQGFSLKTFLKYLELAADKIEAGLKLYRQAARQSPDSIQKRAIKHVLIAEQIKNLLLSEVAILEFEDCRFKLHQNIQANKHLLERMKWILKEELQRTSEFSAIVKKDSRMGYEWEADYFYTPYVIQQKIDLLNDTVKRQIPEFIKRNNL